MTRKWLLNQIAFVNVFLLRELSRYPTDGCVKQTCSVFTLFVQIASRRTKYVYTKNHLLETNRRNDPFVNKHVDCFRNNSTHNLLSQFQISKGKDTHLMIGNLLIKRSFTSSSWSLQTESNCFKIHCFFFVDFTGYDLQSSKTECNEFLLLCRI